MVGGERGGCGSEEGEGGGGGGGGVFVCVGVCVWGCVNAWESKDRVQLKVVS